MTFDIPWSEGTSGCGQIVEFTSEDLELGSTDKAWLGMGAGTGDEQLIIIADSLVDVTTYVESSESIQSRMTKMWSGA